MQFFRASLGPLSIGKWSLLLVSRLPKLIWWPPDKSSAYRGSMEGTIRLSALHQSKPDQVNGLCLGVCHSRPARRTCGMSPHQKSRIFAAGARSTKNAALAKIVAPSRSETSGHWWGQRHGFGIKFADRGTNGVCATQLIQMYGHCLISQHFHSAQESEHIDQNCVRCRFVDTIVAC